MPVTTSRSPALGATARRAVAKLIVTEAKLFVREPVGAFFTVAFPAVLVLVLGSSMPGFTEPSVAGAMVAVALLVAAITPNSRASAGVGTLIYFPMMFFAGVYTPGPVMPDGVRRVADFTPLGAASQAMQDAWNGGWPRPLHLAVMVVLTVLFGAAAARLFRWE